MLSSLYTGKPEWKRTWWTNLVWNNTWTYPITSRLRLSFHSLAIEVERHSRPYIPACSCHCQVCNQVDGEIHYLFHCTKYSTQRAEMFSTVFSNAPPPSSDIEKARILLCSPNVSYLKSYYFNYF